MTPQRSNMSAQGSVRPPEPPGMHRAGSSGNNFQPPAQPASPHWQMFGPPPLPRQSARSAQVSAATPPQPPSRSPSTPQMSQTAPFRIPEETLQPHAEPHAPAMAQPPDDEPAFYPLNDAQQQASHQQQPSQHPAQQQQPLQQQQQQQHVRQHLQQSPGAGFQALRTPSGSSGPGRQRSLVPDGGVV